MNNGILGSERYLNIGNSNGENDNDQPRNFSAHVFKQILG